MLNTFGMYFHIENSLPLTPLTTAPTGTVTGTFLFLGLGLRFLRGGGGGGGGCVGANPPSTDTAAAAAVAAASRIGACVGSRNALLNDRRDLSLLCARTNLPRDESRAWMRAWLR